MGIRLDAAAVAQVRSLGQRGDQMAAFVSAIVDSMYSAEMTAGEQDGNVIAVSGQIKDQDGSKITGVKNLILKAMKTTGTCAITVTTGTVKDGDDTQEVWLETDASGVFVVDVELDSGGQVLLQATLDNGVTEQVKLTYQGE